MFKTALHLNVTHQSVYRNIALKKFNKVTIQIVRSLEENSPCDTANKCIFYCSNK
jgi:hypothetical protein